MVHDEVPTPKRMTIIASWLDTRDVMRSFICNAAPSLRQCEASAICRSRSNRSGTHDERRSVSSAPGITWPNTPVVARNLEATDPNVHVPAARPVVPGTFSEMFITDVLDARKCRSWPEQIMTELMGPDLHD